MLTRHNPTGSIPDYPGTVHGNAQRQLKLQKRIVSIVNYMYILIIHAFVTKLFHNFPLTMRQIIASYFLM